VCPDAAQLGEELDQVHASTSCWLTLIAAIPASVCRAGRARIRRWTAQVASRHQGALPDEMPARDVDGSRGRPPIEEWLMSTVQWPGARGSETFACAVDIGT
jgi:hypothetical protein